MGFWSTATVDVSISLLIHRMDVWGVNGRASTLDMARGRKRQERTRALLARLGLGVLGLGVLGAGLLY